MTGYKVLSTAYAAELVKSWVKAPNATVRWDDPQTGTLMVGKLASRPNVFDNGRGSRAIVWEMRIDEPNGSFRMVARRTSVNFHIEYVRAEG